MAEVPREIHDEQEHQMRSLYFLGGISPARETYPGTIALYEVSASNALSNRTMGRGSGLDHKEAPALHEREEWGETSPEKNSSLSTLGKVIVDYGLQGGNWPNGRRECCLGRQEGSWSRILAPTASRATPNRTLGREYRVSGGESCMLQAATAGWNVRP